MTKYVHIGQTSPEELNSFHERTVETATALLEKRGGPSVVTEKPRRWRYQGMDRVTMRSTGKVGIRGLDGWVSDTVELREVKTVRYEPSKLPILHGLGVMGLRIGLRKSATTRELELITREEPGAGPVTSNEAQATTLSIDASPHPFTDATSSADRDAYLDFRAELVRFGRKVGSGSS